MALDRRVGAWCALSFLLFIGAVPACADTPGVTVTDALGRTVSFARPPQRIVVTGKAVFMIADAIYMFPEASSRIVGIARTAQGPLDFIPTIDRDYRKKMVLDNQAGPEEIAAARPDAVLLKSSMAATLGKTIEALGVPVVYLDFETPQQYERDLVTLGTLFGNSARAGQLIAGFRQRMERTAKALEGLKEESKPRVLLLYYTEQGGAVSVNVPPLGWMQTMLVQMAGGRPVWQDAALGQGWTRVSIEQIAAWDPDQIAVIAYTSSAANAVKKLRADAQWQGLRAVRQGKLFAFPADFYSWDQPDPRWILGLTWLAANVLPDRFKSLDLMEEIRSFYRDFYGIESAAFERSIRPALGGVFP